MRRVIPTPHINMVSMMGLCAVLISMLVVAGQSPLATIETDVPYI